MSFLSLWLKIKIPLARKAQIALLLAKKVNVPAKHSDFDNILMKESAKVLLK